MYDITEPESITKPTILSLFNSIIKGINKKSPEFILGFKNSKIEGSYSPSTVTWATAVITLPATAR